MFALVVIAGSVVEAKLAWEISDTFNGMMMLPNLIGVLILSPQVHNCTSNYVRRKIHGETNLKPLLSMIPEIQEAQEASLAEAGGED